jgi:multiple sugar transport system substrate-binding protein
MFGQPLQQRTRRAGLRAAAHLGSAGAATAIGACALPGTASAPPPTARDVTISYVTDWSGSPRGDFVKAAVPKFQEEYPHFKVQVDNWGGEVTVVAAANAAAGTLQDTMLNSNDVFITLVRGGGWKEITPVLKTLKIKMDDLVYMPSTISYQGKQYGMPFQMGPILMMVNKTLFKTAGAPLPTDKTTYAELLESLRKVAKPAENVWGMSIGGSPGSWGQWLPFVWGWGGERWSNDYKKTLLDQPAAMEGLQFFVDMMHRHQVCAPIDEKGATPSGVSFNNGNVAVGFATAPAAAQDRAVAGKFEWDLMYAPIWPKTGKRVVTRNDQPHVITSAAKKHDTVEESALFGAFLSDDFAQGLIAKMGDSLPVYKKAADSDDFLPASRWKRKVITDGFTYRRGDQGYEYWFAWYSAVNPEMLKATNGEIAPLDAARNATRAGDQAIAAGKLDPSK